MRDQHFNAAQQLLQSLQAVTQEWVDEQTSSFENEDVKNLSRAEAAEAMAHELRHLKPILQELVKQKVETDGLAQQAEKAEQDLLIQAQEVAPLAQKLGFDVPVALSQPKATVTHLDSKRGRSSESLAQQNLRLMREQRQSA